MNWANAGDNTDNGDHWLGRRKVRRGSRHSRGHIRAAKGNVTPGIAPVKLLLKKFIQLIFGALRTRFRSRKMDAVQVHSLFPDLQLHTDEELASLLDGELMERETIHQWPLSCVQRLRLDDGRRLVYKSQLPPTLEVPFYERVTSPLLARHQYLGQLGRCEVMTLEWIEAPLLSSLVHSEAELVEHGRRVIAEIGRIQENLPVYLDISSTTKWNELVNCVSRDLETLIRGARFRSVPLESIGYLREWAASGEIKAEMNTNSRLCHGDLLARQIFVTGGGYRVIDWQRPILAPAEIDLVSLLDEAKIDPTRYVSRAINGIFWFLRLQWAVEAQTNLFPDFRGPLFDQWAGGAVEKIVRS